MRQRYALLSLAALLAVFICTNNGVAAPNPLPAHDQFDIKTKTFDVSFEVGGDGRLYQIPVGGKAPDKKTIRDAESYPQAGDGYVWEPALELVHADGNTSTALHYVGTTRIHKK